MKLTIHNRNWVAISASFIGLTEIKGPKHNADILKFWKDIKRGGIKDDETAWCAGFVGAMLVRAGLKIPTNVPEGARSYLTWGKKLDKPANGCIVVFTRDGGGHVGFVVGKDENGNLLVLGGNQGDAVNVKAFSTSRVTGYRWPDEISLPTADDYNLPISSGHALSQRES